jgi:cytochrome c
MTFAGLGNPEDRANLMAYMNTKSPAPLPLPAAPASPEEATASTPGAAADKAASEADDAGAQKAKNVPVITEQQAAQAPGSIRGEGASKINGPEPTVKQ